MEIERRQVTKLMRFPIPEQPVTSSAERVNQVAHDIPSEVAEIITDQVVKVGEKKFALIHLVWIIPLVFTVGAFFVAALYEEEKKKQKIIAKNQSNLYSTEISSETVISEPVSNSIQRGEEAVVTGALSETKGGYLN